MPEIVVQEFTDNSAEPHVRGSLHLPASSNSAGLVLTHGAGSNAQAPLLVALADTFASAGYTVLRCDLPYRPLRSFGPPGPGDAARDQAGLKNAVASLQKVWDAPLLEVPRSGNSEAKKPRTLFLGGHSYGGRQSSMLCAKEPDLVAGLLLLSYPLHPPRKPEQQRTQHLPDLRTPTLFVSGTRDPFGSIDELAQALKMIPAKTKLLAVEGAGHDLGFKGKNKQGVIDEIVSEFKQFNIAI